MKFAKLTAPLMALALAACATGGGTDSKSAKFDPKAAEKARPYLANHYGLDYRFTSAGTCSEPTAKDEWKTWVLAASGCVQKGDWSRVEKLGVEMSARHVDSPWGAYFLGIAAAERKEMLRAQWMLDLAERKAGGPIGLVRYEKARLLEKEEGVPAAAKEMKEAVQADATLMPAILWLAQIHHRDRMNREAEKYYRDVLALKSDSWPALSGLGAIMLENKNGPEAASLLSRAIALKPEVAETRIKLAFVYETLTQEPAKALQTLRELRVALEKGRAKGKLGLDLNAKIKTIEQTMKPQITEQAREPAQQKGRAAQEPKKGG